MTILDRLLGRQTTRKAVTGPGVLAYQNPSLSSLGLDPQQRMAAFLRAYRVNWFYKAERKISTDLAGLAVQVAPEDSGGDNQEAILAADLLVPWDELDPVQQFLRLMERPNPYQTGRALRAKTQIRRDMAGAAFWYLEGASDYDLPTAIYGISPARMWPSYDNRGRLIGWVMDKDAPSGGVPFSTDEIIPFISDGADDGYCPQGVVEAVFAEVGLDPIMKQHTADQLTLGGRLNGMLWPKDRALGEDEYQQVIRSWRNVASDPNAARRMLVFPEPMEWAQGAATPDEVGIPELASLHRDEILTAFPISPYQLGVPMPGGLNSAETRREDRRDYWENTIHPRAEEFEEIIQVHLMARYEAVIGSTLDFELVEPNLDDAVRLLEKTEAFKGLVAVGFDPKASVEAVGLDHIEWTGLPAILDPAKQLQMQQEAEQARTEALSQRPTDEPPTTPPPAKAVLREDVLGKEAPGSEAAMRRFLTDQRDRLIGNIRATYRPRKTAEDWWDAEAEDEALRLAMRESRRRITRSAIQKVADDLDRVVMPDRIERVASRALRAAGTRITNINETTRQAVADVLAEGSRRGYSIDQLVRGVPDEGFVGVQDAPMKNGVSAFDELRAETIARTETMQTWNDAALHGYRDFGVRHVEAIDGDEDTECAERHGQVFSTDEALEVADHPNGTLDWVPVLDKSIHEDDDVTEDDVKRIVAETVKAVQSGWVVPAVTFAPQITVPEAGVTVNVPEQAAPIVNVEAPVVNVETPTPVVTVKAEPQVIVSESSRKALPDVMDVRLVESILPPRKRKVKRDQMGRITDIIEE